MPRHREWHRVAVPESSTPFKCSGGDYLHRGMTLTPSQQNKLLQSCLSVPLNIDLLAHIFCCNPKTSQRDLFNRELPMSELADIETT